MGPGSVAGGETRAGGQEASACVDQAQSAWLRAPQGGEFKHDPSSVRSHPPSGKQLRGLSGKVPASRERGAWLLLDPAETGAPPLWQTARSSYSEHASPTAPGSTHRSALGLGNCVHFLTAHRPVGDTGTRALTDPSED